ncbi:hypothetical protein ABK040_011420 [Willaertia magna]
MISHNNNGISNDNSSSLTTINNNNNTFNNNKEEEIISKIKKWKQQLEKHICPISQQLMIDPVIIESGHTFERSSIEEWLKSNNTCPITRKKIKTTLILPNINAKSAISENIEIFIKKVIKNVNIWSSDVNLIDICLELINYSLDLIKNENNFKIFEKEMQKLQFNILLKEQNEDKLFNNYILFINTVYDLNYKIELLKKLQNKLTKENLLQKYYIELINLLIESKNNENLLNKIFINYCKINNIDNIIINKLFNYLENKDNIILEYLIILFNDTNYSKNIILQHLVNLNIEYNKNEFQNFITDEIVDKNKLIYLFKHLIKEDNLKNINLKILFNLIKNYYNYVNIINIETPLNVKKLERFSSDEFEVFGLKWKINIYPNGNYFSKENECAIFLWLNSLQNEISSIKIKFSIDSITLNDNNNYECNFTKLQGRGNPDFKQSNFIPIIKNDKQIFSIVIGMKKLDIQFKTNNNED